MRLLLIDGNDLSVHALTAVLGAESFQVSPARSGDKAIEMLRIYEYDAIVVSRKLSIEGNEIAQLRGAGIAAPILALVDDTKVSSRIAALSQGADDCLPRPFDKAELSARLRAIIRRSRAHPHPVARIGNLQINFETREVRVGAKPISLTTTEYRMLEMLALRNGTMVSRERLFEALYDGDDEPEEKVINVFVCKIRKKIAAANRGVSYIATSWGAGYSLRDPAVAAA